MNTTLPENEPNIEELVTRALADGVIDSEFAEELRGYDDLEEALGMFYTHAISEERDPEELLRHWGIIE